MYKWYLSTKYKIKRRKEAFIEWLIQKYWSIINSKPFIAIMMLAIGISWTVAYYEAPKFIHDYKTAVQIADQIIEKRHADVVKPIEEEAATDVTPTSTEDKAALSAPLEKRLIKITTYNAEVGQTDADPFTMANGEKVYEGAIASNCYPLGTKLHLEGLGEFTVSDRMNRRFTADCGTEKERADIFKWNREDNGMWEGVELTVIS